MKTKIWQIGILLSLLALTLSRPAAAQVGAGTGSDPAMPALGSSSVMFIENVGQFPEGVRFRVYGGDRALWLAEDALWISAVERAQGGTLERLKRLRGEPANVEPANVQGVNLKLTFPGATPHPRLEPFGRLETSVNYFLGNDPEKWRTHVPVWSGVRYVDLYPGVDLEVTGEAGRWSWRLVTRAGADLSAVHLQVEGAEEVDVLATASGRQGLRLRTAVGDFTLPLLRVERANVERGNVERINAQTFEVTSPFSSAPWLPGPSVQAAGASDLAYATFLGGSGGDQSYGIAVDGAGNAYVTGATDSPDFPATPGAFDTTFNGDEDAFVVKLSPTGNTLLYTSFLGGAGNEWGNDIIVDQNGNAYVTGTTDSYDFPVTLEAYDVSFNGNRDIFVAKLNPTGNNLLYATFLGGSNLDGGTGIDVDGNGNAYITGTTESSDFPTTPGAHDMGFNGYVDVFIAKLGSLGSNLAYATFLGGSSWDDGARIAVDTDGNAYITGTTSSFDFPVTPKAYNTSFNGGYHDIFVAKFSPIGSDLLYATFLGGNNEDFGSDIAVDPDGNALITGNTSSSDFPVTPGAYDTSLDGPSDVFVTKLGPEGGNVLYATFLGGSNWDLGTGIHVDENGNAYITGQTLSSDFPATPEVYDNSLNNGHNNYDNLDIFLVKLNPMENDLPYVTLLGGTDREESQDITIDKNGNIYVTGWTGSSDFPITPGAFDNVFDGDSDTFVVKLAPDVEPATHSVSGRVTDANGAPLSGVTITDDAGHTTTTDGDGRYTLSGLAEGTYTVTPAKEDFTFSPASRTVSVPPDAEGVDFVGSSTVNPLVFIPGITGSYLREREGTQDLWPGQRGTDRSALSNRPGQRHDIIAPDVIRRAVLNWLPDQNIYAPLLERLTSNYIEYQVAGDPARRTSGGCDLSQKEAKPTLFVFAYDWRLSNDFNADLLKEYVACIHRFYPGAKIDIVAHSMGGLIARRYILKTAPEHFVRKVITVGTPWLGAPKFLNVLENGELGLANILVWSDEVAWLLEAFPGAHELMPSATYFEYAARSGEPDVFTEEGYDINRDGNELQRYDYDTLVNYVNDRYPRENDCGEPKDPVCRVGNNNRSQCRGSRQMDRWTPRRSVFLHRGKSSFS